MDATTAILVGAVLAGFVQGLSGFGFALTAMTIWSWALAPDLAGPLAVGGSFVGQLASIASLRAGFDWRRLLPFVAGGLIGVPLGAALLPHIAPLIYQTLIGAFLVLWCSAMLAIRNLPPIRRGGRLADAVSGLAGGLMGGLGGMSGPAPTLWCTLRGWEKDTQRAVFQVFNITMHTLTLSVYAATGLMTGPVLRGFALLTPVVLVTAFLGTRLYRRLSDAVFRRMVLALLAISGLALLATAAPKLL